MNADLIRSLIHLNKSYKCFTHRGCMMTKEDVKNVLVYGIQKGYSTTAELTDEEVDKIISNLPVPKAQNENEFLFQVQTTKQQ